MKFAAFRLEPILTTIHNTPLRYVFRYVAYGGVYTVLEVLAVPAVPLTMTAGLIFGPVFGVVIVSGASTAAATLSFLIARYAARDRVEALLSSSLRNLKLLCWRHDIANNAASCSIKRVLDKNWIQS